MINIEIVYATPEKQALLTVTLFNHCTIAEAILQSDILMQFPEIDLNTASVGIFSTLCSMNKQVQEGDRIEIYRPLQHDPKDSRRQRALKTSMMQR